MNAPRCQPGQMARYIGKDPACIGWIVQVVKLHAPATAFFGVAMWVTDPPLPGDSGEGPAAATADYLLKPLDNPGDDEVDEISLRRDVPEGVPA